MESIRDVALQEVVLAVDEGAVEVVVVEVHHHLEDRALTSQNAKLSLT